jgi:hypothetical protein
MFFFMKYRFLEKKDLVMLRQAGQKMLRPLKYKVPPEV